MDNSAIKDKIIEIIEEAGFSSRTAAAINHLSSGNHDTLWFGYEGFSNAAFMVDNVRVLIRSKPSLHGDNLICCFTLSYNNIVMLKNFNEDSFRKIVNDMKEKAVEVLKSRKKLIKDRRIKMIREL